jgi:flagellar basal-body rod protein FlgC
MTAITTAVSGLLASEAQLSASAANLANEQTVGSLSGSGSGFGPAYQPVSVVQSTAPGGGVSTTYAPVTPGSQPAYDPTSPAADAQGMVAAPNVDPAQEMVGQMGALRSYQANLATLKVADEMQKSLLAIA